MENQTKMSEMLLRRGKDTAMIGEEDIKRAAEILNKYKAGKQNLESRIVEGERWWQLRHWEVMPVTKKDKSKTPQATSAWLFNALLNKHADAMDNIPEPVVLPREASDKESAKMLTDVLPVVMEYNEFDDTYSSNWWEKLKHGTACYGVFWDSEKENGLGDIDIQQIDLLKIFWEPGIQDIQDSKNLFIVELIDTKDLQSMYPDKDIKESKTIDVKEYMHDDTVDNSDKSVVIDWYYKTRNASGKTIVNYVKFVGNTLLYASENTEEYRDNGYYNHGLYPVVFDCLFPEKGTPAGFGYINICKDPQMYIDALMSNILESAMMNTKKRFFVSEQTNINIDEFKDWSGSPLVKVNGAIDDTRIQEIICQPISSIYLSVVNQKIEEMKDTTGNRDVNSGGTSSGVTSGAAISALQEAGNKTSRDIISAAYRAYKKINDLCIELMRQFYEEERMFRISMPNGDYEFVSMSNAGLKDQVIGYDSEGVELVRRPTFDLNVKAQKKNPFSRMEGNERAKELFGMGFFNPDNADMALMALDMMSFEGVEDLKTKIAEGKTMANMLKQMQAENMALKQTLQVATGGAMQTLGEDAQLPNPQNLGGMPQSSTSTDSMEGYRQRLADNARPTVTGE